MPAITREPMVGGTANHAKTITVGDGETKRVAFAAAVSTGHVLVVAPGGVTGTITPVVRGVEGTPAAVAAGGITSEMLDPAPTHVVLTASGGALTYAVTGRS